MKPAAVLGIIGGGQLGRMLAQAALPLGVQVQVLDPDADCPAGPLAARHLKAGYGDLKALSELAQGCDAVTLEIEAPPAELLGRLEAAGVPVRPGASVLARIQDKLEQRRFFRAVGLPQPRFLEALPDASRAVAQFGEPCVLKARRQGYDGRGVLLPEGPQDPRLTGWEAPSLVEQRLELAEELAVLVVRGLDGAIRSYDPVQMEMDPQLHLLDVMVGPARVGPALGQRARQVAERAVEALGGVGAFGVELFVDQGGRILLNEVSPRVHNSGHHSLEACGTSQFENHLRAVLGWPLGDTGTLRPSALVNLLGPQGLRGGFQVRGLEQALALPGVHVHLYGKAETRPGRKLGHLTALASTAEEALHLARTARGTLSFVEAK